MASTKKKTAAKPKAATKAKTAPAAPAKENKVTDAAKAPEAAPPAVPVVEGETAAAAKAKASEKVDVIVKRVGGQRRFADVSVNGRPSRFKLNERLTVTADELEALRNADADLELVS